VLHTVEVRHVAAALGCALALAVGGCAGDVRTMRRAAEVEVDPTFTEWPQRIEGVDDATALFAGFAPSHRAG
jgi:hypothetical protein